MPSSLKPPIVVHHMAALDSSPYPPNSLEAIASCIEVDAPFIEIDVTALHAADFLLVHDSILESETTGYGDVSGASVETAKTLWIKHRREKTPYRPPLLSEVVTLFLEKGGYTRLQIDFKNVLPMRDDEPLRRLVQLIEPLRDRVQVSSSADWHLRSLHRLASWLDLGFDIGFYLDYRPHPVDPRLPPFRLGAYGYHDDHILAAQSLLNPAAYLEERCDLLYRSIPNVSTWYVNYRLIMQCLADGFNMADWLHRVDIKLAAWTLDADQPSILKVLSLLKSCGVDQYTTNTPRALAAMLD